MSTRVSQAQLVSTFLNPLLSNDPDAQKLAIKALLIALPEEGPDLVQTLSSTTDDGDIKQFAEAAWTMAGPTWWTSCFRLTTTCAVQPRLNWRTGGCVTHNW